MFPTAVQPVVKSKSRPSSAPVQASSQRRWMCTKCTIWNDGNYVNCTTCMTRRPGQKIDLKEEQEQMPQMGVVNPRFSHRLKSLFSKTPPEWSCPLCTYVNGGYYTQCQSCRFLRLAEKRQSHDGESSVDKDQGEVKRKTRSATSNEEHPTSTPSVFESIKAFFRRSSDTSRSKDASKKLTEREERGGEGGEEEEGEWGCRQCTFLNRDPLSKCALCDLPRDLDTPDSFPSKSVQSERDSSSNTPSLCQGRASETTQSKESNTDPHVDHSSSVQGVSETDGTPTALPMVPDSPQIKQSFVSSQGAPTWCCGVCGAYNVVSLTQCFICGIGIIPECYLPVTVNSLATFTPQSATSTKLESCSNQSHDQQQKLNPLPKSSEPDYVNVFTPLAPLNQEQPHKSSPHHPLTHFNQLQVSPTPSPQHITGSNGRVVPLMEQAQPTSANSEFRVGLSSHRLRTTSNDRVFPDIEQAQPSYQHSAASNGRVFPYIEQAQPSYLSSCESMEFQPWSSSFEESCMDPYTRPRTPTNIDSVLREQQPVKKPTTLHQRQRSEERDKRHQLENSVHYNRTKCLRETRDEDVVRANTIYQEIQHYSRKSCEPFTDPDFPPADKSLYSDPRQPVLRWRVGKWERPAGTRDDFESDGIDWTVVRNPRPEDIAQGVLGNCWVLSALGVIAEQPQLVEDILITKEYSPRVGAYQVRLCKDGKWEIVVIDDCFPCLNSGELVFSKAHRKQLWVPLIEKALAKLYGSYEALNAGRVLLGLSVLTGLPCEKIHLKKFSLKGDAIDTDLVWARLLSFRERGFPMSASCGGDGEEGVYAMLGLEANHAYSILDVRQLGSERLVRLRNPWGKYSWKGSWSDQDARWDSHPYLREELQAVGADAGVFWMGAQEFFQYFCEVDVCKYRPNWHSLRFEGKLLPYAARQIKTLAFEVNTTTEVDISIYQPSSRGRSSHHNLVDMAVLVLRYSDTHNPHPSSHSSPLPVSCSLHSGSLIQSIVTTNGFLAPGRYIILPLAFNNYRHVTAKSDRAVCNGHEYVEREQSEEGSIPYVVAVFSAQELAYENVTTRPGFLSESLMLLAEKIGKVTEPFPKMLLYEVYMRHSCRYVVAVNLDKKHHFTVTCDGLDSVNVLCSRGELYTEDCVPPRHKQVLWVLTQLEGTARYSVLMRITSTCTQLNAHKKWGAHHLPSLTHTTSELHAPRLIS